MDEELRARAAPEKPKSEEPRAASAQHSEAHGQPLALRDRIGTIRAWACPRCYRVSMSVSCGGPDGRERETEHSYERAKECGVCRTCGAVARDCHWFGAECDACREQSATRFREELERDRPEREQRQAEQAATRQTQMLAMLADLSLLQDRDWTDDEDLAAELLPVALAELSSLRLQAGRADVSSGRSGPTETNSISTPPQEEP